MANLNYGELLNVDEEIYLPFRSKKYKCKSYLQLFLIIVGSFAFAFIIGLLLTFIFSFETSVPIAIFTGFFCYMLAGNMFCKVDEETEQSRFSKWYIVKFKKLNYVITKDNENIAMNQKKYKGNICYLSRKR